MTIVGLLCVSLAACGTEPATIPPPSRTRAPTLAVTTSATMPTSPTSVATTTPSLAPPTATLTPAGTPQIISFTASPTTTNKVGDVIRFAWQAIGEQAQLCPLFGTGPLDALCVPVPLTGAQSVTIDESKLPYVGYVLRVTVGANAAISAVDLKLQCQGLRDWFFANPPLRCPASARMPSKGAAQHFERGMMIWSDIPDAFYVFFDEPSQSFPHTAHIVNPIRLKPGASPDHRIGETPPAGRYEPVSGFGMVWRGEIEGADNIRQRLGWGLDSEFAFETAYQCETPAQPRSWTCYLRVPDGKVLRLYPDSTAQVRVLWEEYSPQ